jgi:hypothetical protein
MEILPADAATATIGVYAAAGTASFDWFDYEVMPG